MSKKRIVFISCNELDGFVHCDAHLQSALEKRNCTVETQPWESLQDDGQDLFLIRTAWNYTEHLERFLLTLEPIGSRLSNPLSVVRWNSNKKYLIELQNKDLPILPVEIVSSQQELEPAMSRLGGEQFIIKPLVGASAVGLQQFSKETLANISGSVLLQKFYPEILAGEVSLMYFSGDYSFAVRKTPKSGDIRVQEEYGGLIEPYSATSEDRVMAESVLEQVPGDWLYARVDLIPGLGLMELELIEPALYFGQSQSGASDFADKILKSFH